MHQAVFSSHTLTTAAANSAETAVAQNSLGAQAPSTLANSRVNILTKIMNTFYEKARAQMRPFAPIA